MGAVPLWRYMQGGGSCSLSPAALFTIAACFLAFNYALEYLFALEIYVVPFSNAKVVGSFRMARLNMFRR